MTKNRLLPANLLLCFCLLIFNYKINAQCTQQVFTTSGTAVINGVNITVTSTGVIDSLTYCAGVTNPYFIGYTFSTNTSGTGSYIFNFSPSISGVTLNFGGTSDTPPHTEEVKLYVNGQHYAIPAVGNTNPCEPLAILTPAGDLAACGGCSVSGWNGTTISGTISSLIVTDTVISGQPAGTVFSLFICDSVATEIDEWEGENFPVVYPNPAKDFLFISTGDGKNFSIALYNSAGMLMDEQFYFNASTIEYDVKNYPNGFYILKLTKNNFPVYKKIVVDKE